MGIDEARETINKIKEEVRQENTQTAQTEVVRVERSGAIGSIRPNLTIAGLTEVPVSMIPLPFYKLVQPGSTNITLADGTDAIPGTFFMGDTGKSVVEIRFALLRAKRMHREFVNTEGETVHSTSLAVLGINMENMSPFVMNISVASFSNFGRMLSQMKDLKVEKAWQYPVKMTTEKREEMKETPKGTQRVKYWVINFEVEKEQTDQIGMEVLDSAYQEFAGNLDRNAEEEVKTDMPF